MKDQMIDGIGWLRFMKKKVLSELDNVKQEGQAWDM